MWAWGGPQGPLYPPFPVPARPQGPADPLLPWCPQTALSGPSPGQVVAPVSGNSLGARRAEIKPGVREIHLCKDERGKTGLRLRAIDKVRPGAGRERGPHAGLRGCCPQPRRSESLQGCGCTAWQPERGQRAGEGRSTVRKVQSGAGWERGPPNPQAPALALSPLPQCPRAGAALWQGPATGPSEGLLSLRASLPPASDSQGSGCQAAECGQQKPGPCRHCERRCSPGVAGAASRQGGNPKSAAPQLRGLECFLPRKMG